MKVHDLKEFLSLSVQPEDLKKYGKDWSMNFEPDPSAIVFPESEEQVLKLVQWANQHKVNLVPSGGRTGLSSAATATNQEVVVSFEKMNQILEFNEVDQVVRVQPGVITEDLHKFVEEKGKLEEHSNSALSFTIPNSTKIRSWCW